MISFHLSNNRILALSSLLISFCFYHHQSSSDIGCRFANAFNIPQTKQRTTRYSLKSKSLSSTRATVQSKDNNSMGDKTKRKENINFEDWISDAPDEVLEKKKLVTDGKIPDYVVGSLLRNGPGLWSTSDQMFSHLFDGLAKISSYEIKSDGDVYFQTRFIQSTWYKKLKSSTKIPACIGVGPVLDKKTKEIVSTRNSEVPKLLELSSNMLQFDNPCVNIWDYKNNGNSDGVVHALTDAPPHAQISMENLNTLKTSARTPSTENRRGYEFTCTTHPEYSKLKDDTTYNISVEIGLKGPRVILTEATNENDRKIIGRSKPISSGVPYIHSFGVNGRYVTCVVQPFRYEITSKKLRELGLFRSFDQVDYTQLLVFDLEQNGKVVLDKKVNEKIFFYHTISATCDEDQNEVSIRLCAYKNSGFINGENQFMRLEKCQQRDQAQGKENRNKIGQLGTVCDITCNLKSGSVQVVWKESEQRFEMPLTRYSRLSGKEKTLTSRHPRYFYTISNFANGADEYDAMGLFKFDTSGDDGNKIIVSASYEGNSQYFSEPIFVPDPMGTEEDDGVLLSQVYDGNRRETGLFILSAKTMELLATSWTGQRSAMDFHGTWIQSSN